MRILIIGNSDGIGAAVTQALVGRGDRVIGVSRSACLLAAPNFRHEVLDVTSPEYPRLLERLVVEEGDMDACIYCVGVGSALELPDLSNEARVFEVNLTAMVRTMEVLAPRWIARRRGHFVGLSSLADALYSREAPSYSASKAGFSNYLSSMGLRLREHGVSITNVRFGFVDTKMAKAPVRPFMITAGAAARHVVRALERRPMQVSVPRRTAAAAWVIGAVQAMKVRLTQGRV